MLNIPGTPLTGVPLFKLYRYRYSYHMASTPRTLTSSEFAILQHVSVRRIRALAAAGRIPGARKLGRDWMIPAQVKIGAGTRGPSMRVVIHTATARAFKLLDQLDQFKSFRQVSEAVRVQSMSAKARIKWLQNTWGSLQRQPLAQPSPGKNLTRQFPSMEEKNRQEQAAEIAAAVKRPRSSRLKTA